MILSPGLRKSSEMAQSAAFLNQIPSDATTWGAAPVCDCKIPGGGGGSEQCPKRRLRGGKWGW